MTDVQRTPLTIDPADLLQAFGQSASTCTPQAPAVAPGDGLEAVWAAVRAAGEGAGLGLLAASVVTGLRARVSEVTARVGAGPAVTVALSGPWSPGTTADASPRWVSDLLQAAGGRTAAPEAAEVTLILGPEMAGDTPRSDVRVAIDLRRPGPRLAEAAEVLAAALHPERCSDLAVRHAARIARRTRPPGN